MKQYCCIDVSGYKNKLCIFVGPSNDSLYDYVVYVICDQKHVHVKKSEITFFTIGYDMSELEELAARYPYTILNIRRLHVMIADIETIKKLLDLWVDQRITNKQLSTIIFSMETVYFNLT